MGTPALSAVPVPHRGLHGAVLVGRAHARRLRRRRPDRGTAGVTIEVDGHRDHRADEVDPAGRQAYEARANVKIKLTNLENEAYKSKMTALVASGKLPDIYVTVAACSSSRSTPGWSRTSPPTSHRGRTPCTPASRNAYTFDGKTYGFPSDIGMVGFWYNKELFTKAGISEAADDLGGVPRRRPQAEGRERHPDRAGRQGEVARPLLLGLPGHAHRRTGRPAAGRRRQGLQQARLRRGRAGRSRSWSTSSRSRTASSAPATPPRTVRPPPWATARRPWSSWASGRPRSRPTSGKKASATTSASSRSRRSTGGKGTVTDAFGGGGGRAGKDAPADRRLPQVHRAMGNHRKSSSERRAARVVKGRERDQRPQPQAGQRPAASPPGSSCTWTRPTRPPSASRSTTAWPS